MPDTYIHLFLFAVGGILGMVAILWAMLAIFMNPKHSNAPRPKRRKHIRYTDPVETDFDAEGSGRMEAAASAVSPVDTEAEDASASYAGGEEAASVQDNEQADVRDADAVTVDAPQPQPETQEAAAAKEPASKRRRKRKPRKRSKSVQRLYDNYADPPLWTEYVVENLDDLDSVVTQGRSKEDEAYNMLAKNAAQSRVKPNA